MKSAGILCGISSGAAVAAVVQMVKSDPQAFKHKNIVTILPDSGERYLSSILFSDS
jgi:cysteine synthase A